MLSGILELRDRKDTDRDQSGNCTIVDAPDERVGFMGIYTGNTISGAVFTEYEMIPLNATVSGDTITGSGTAEDSATFTFSITRFSASPAPTVLKFAADPSLVRAGDPTTLFWTVFNAATVSIDQGIGTRPAAGSASVLPSSTTTYTLTATASSGMTVTAQTTVTVTPFANPPVILQFHRNTPHDYPRSMLKNAGLDHRERGNGVDRQLRPPPDVTVTVMLLVAEPPSPAAVST